MIRKSDTHWSLVDEMRVARDNLVIHNLVTLQHIFGNPISVFFVTYLCYDYNNWTNQINL